MDMGWLAVAFVIVAFWAVPIAATLALFPAGSRTRRPRGTDDD
jgi:ABC-type uncharacterized transport system permease subunit